MTSSQPHPHGLLATYCIDAKLRSLRLNKRLTLAQLAAETGLSPALLSKLETGRMVPTLATLATICRVYGVGLGHFFCDAAEHSRTLAESSATEGAARRDSSPSVISEPQAG